MSLSMLPIEGSSNVKAIGYDPDSQLLRVQFHSGAIYNFSGVSADKHEAFLHAASKGQHFQKNIRGKHPSEKV